MASLLTVRKAAERMGVGYSTFKQWIYRGTGVKAPEIKPPAPKANGSGR